MINEGIQNIVPLADQLKREQESDITRKFQTEIVKWRKKLEEQKASKGDRADNLKDKENEMQHNLDLITELAQRFDNENRLLIKKNGELRQEFKSQENDRELLVRQLVMQKKENQKYKQEIDEFKRFINSNENKEEQIDLQKLGNDNDTKMPPIQSKLMQSRLNNQTDRNKPPLANTYSNLGHTTAENVTLNAKQETDEDRVQRYERVIDHLKKMIDGVKKQNKATRVQFEREISSKTELEHYFKKAVNKVLKERKQAREEKKLRQSHSKFYITALDSEPKLTGPIQDDNDLN